MEHPSNKAWGVLAVGVLIYDWLAPTGETMSEAVDRAIERHPIITIGAIGAVALHLINALPERVDPLHKLAEVFRNE